MRTPLFSRVLDGFDYHHHVKMGWKVEGTYIFVSSVTFLGFSNVPVLDKQFLFMGEHKVETVSDKGELHF